MGLIFILKLEILYQIPMFTIVSRTVPTFTANKCKAIFPYIICELLNYTCPIDYSRVANFILKKRAHLKNREGQTPSTKLHTANRRTEDKIDNNLCVYSVYKITAEKAVILTTYGSSYVFVCHKWLMAQTFVRDHPFDLNRDR